MFHFVDGAVPYAQRSPSLSAAACTRSVLEVAGEFEIHITAHAQHAERMAAFAAEHGSNLSTLCLIVVSTSLIRCLPAPGITSGSAEARALLDDLKTALRTAPGAGLQPDLITESAIWTYERADGRRLVIPFSAPEAPDGHVQLDVVFGEELPLPPEALILPDVDAPL